jgi:hypothetical protein
VSDIWNKPCYVESAFDRIQRKLKEFKNNLKDGDLTYREKQERKNKKFNRIYGS